jgi:hypothetical protein
VFVEVRKLPPAASSQASNVSMHWTFVITTRAVIVAKTAPPFEFTHWPCFSQVEGKLVGASVGIIVGDKVGSIVGDTVGSIVGEPDSEVQYSHARVPQSSDSHPGGMKDDTSH